MLRCRHCGLPWWDDALTIDALCSGVSQPMPVCPFALPGERWMVDCGINGHMFDDASNPRAQATEIELLRALLADAQECIADRGQLIADRMTLRAALAEALDAIDHGCDREYGICVGPPLSCARSAELRKLAKP